MKLAFARWPLLLCLLMAATACGARDSKSAETPTDSEEETLALVRVEEVIEGSVSKRLEATANIESLDVVNVIPERVELVTEVLAEEGDIVRKGQVLAQLRDSEAKLALAEANVRVDEAAVARDKAERDHQRNLRLRDSSTQGGTVLVSESDLENSLQAWNAAKTLHAAAEVARDREQLALERCTLLSPIDGTVTAREISVGDLTSTTRAFELTDLSAPKVVFYRPQRELVDLAIGQPLTATSEALPGLVISGQIERIAPVVDQATGTVKVVAALDPGERVLPTGILVEVKLVLDVREGVTLVPKKALLYEAGNVVSCYVVDADAAGQTRGVVRKLEVFSGYENATHLEVLPETGLKAGDWVVVVGADRLADGDSVELADE